jgi:hypothetical protein
VSNPRPNVLSLVALVLVLTGSVAAPSPWLPAANHEPYTRQGFRVFLNTAEGHGAPALRCLDDRLKEALGALPPAFRDVLREVPVWVEPGGSVSVESDASRFSCYYLPLTDKRSPKSPTDSGVVIGAVRLLPPAADWLQEAQPGWLLHEFAHAIHDRVFGFNHTGIQDAYRQAMDRKLYDEVEARGSLPDGRPFQTVRLPAYARTNALEYFGELSATYMGKHTGYFPFTPEEFRKHDAVGHALVERLWRSVPSTVVNEFPFPVSVDRVAQTGRRFHLFDVLPGKSKAFDAWHEMTLVATDQLDGTEYKFAAPSGPDQRWRLREAVP